MNVTEKNEETKESGSQSSKLVSILLILLALVYIVMPLDYDGPLIGYIDDFFLFMAAFCYFICQFTESVSQKTKAFLNMISIIFCILGIAWLFILAFTPVANWVA